MPRSLLSIAEARRAVLAAAEEAGPLPSERVPVADALGRVLATDLTAGGDVPSFANSAMDGFAVLAGPAGRRLRIAGESRAGHPTDAPVTEDAAIRVSTGAALPPGAEAVVRLEDATEHDDGTVELRTAAAPGENVREPGEDLRAGTTVLRTGTRLGPAALAAAVGAGAAALECARRPALALVATGDELVPAGAPLGPGQIHNTNAYALAALAARAGAAPHQAGQGVGDDREQTRAALGGALDGADVLLISGGVSVGPHDHVKPALAELGVAERFWGVALKPGKPTWFGTHGRTLVFGLPGNPVSAMVTFALFAAPALRALQGAPAEPPPRTARLATAVPRLRDREQALRVRLAEDPRDGVLTAEPTGPQGSHLVSSMLDAGGLALIEAGEGELPAGTRVPLEDLG